jgi:apolipoprotein N-acyltransferase
VPLICYEIIFPGLGLGEEVDFILNALNEEWFTSLEKYQSLDMSRLRAVEEGVPVVRVANMSISAVISPSGRLVTGDKIFPDGRSEKAYMLAEKAVLDVEVPKRIGRTLFSKTGNWLVVGLFILGLVWVFWPAGGTGFTKTRKK